MQVYATSNLQKARSAFVIKIGMVLHHWSISNACAVRPQLHEVSSLADHSPIPTVRPSWVKGGGTGGTGLVSPVACAIAGMFLSRSKRSKTRLKAVVRSTRTNPEAAAVAVMQASLCTGRHVLSALGPSTTAGPP